MVARFSFVGDRSFVPAATVGFGYGLSLELPLTANGSSIQRMTERENRTLSFHLQYDTVCYHCIGNYIPQSIPVEGWMLLLLMTAIAPRRRRMTPSAARERSSQGTDETTLGSNRTCTNKIHPHPHIKVLRSFFKSDRSPRSPRSPVPPVIAGSHSPPRHKDGRCKGGIGGRRRREAPERHGGGADRAQRRLRRQRGARIRDRRRERP